MSTVVYQDVVGEPARLEGPTLSGLSISQPLRDGLIAFFGNDISLSPPQTWALDEGILEVDDHYLVCAPTNSGKTLIAIIRMFHRALERGDRSVYIVPLKALAEEKAEEFRGVAKAIRDVGGPLLTVRVSTGDYMLSEDFLGSPPPGSGEIVICTPERLEVILRKPDNLAWAKAARTYVIDEFHLLGESGRGAVVESLVTRLITQVPESTIFGLSATIGNAGRVAGWLGHTGKPVHVLDSKYRFPALHRRVVETIDKDRFVRDAARTVVESPSQSLLVFVYRKADAEKLCKDLRPERSTDQVVLFFHAGLTLAQRRAVAESFRQGRTKVLVATTSLKMGVNTPATTVIVRDVLFHGTGRLPMTDVLQMIGRAGRGTAAGIGYVVTTNPEDSALYANGLEAQEIESIQPQLFPARSDPWGRDSNGRGITRRAKGKRTSSARVPTTVASALLAEIARRDQVQKGELEAFFAHSFSVWVRDIDNPDLTADLSVLERGKLIYGVENTESTYSATKLGRTVSFCGMSPETGAMLASFLRALINLGKKESDESKSENYLRRLRDLDLLVLACASYECRDRLLEPVSAKLRAHVDEYIESLPIEDKPLLYLWRQVDSEDYPTRRLLSSLGFTDQADDKKTINTYYGMMASGVALYRHSRGEHLHTLGEEYRIHTGTLENGLKYTTTWILSCLAQICSPDKCYKLEFIAMHAYSLLENLALGASLGKLLEIKGIGRKTVLKFVDAGYTSLDQIVPLSKSTMTDLAPM